MNFTTIKYVASSALALLLSLSAVSCADDLSMSSTDPQTSSSVDQEQYYAKIYALMVLSGQKGVTDTPDISDDPGKNPFFRRVWEANEFPTDECIWTWQNDTGQPEFLNMSWNNEHLFTRMLYNRLGYNITQCNYFLDCYSQKTDAESVRQCAEVRFFRAMYFQYFLDLFGKAPFKTTFDANLPVEKAGQELFDFIESEYLAIEDAVDAPEPNAATFGRVNRAAVWMMLARLYLNAEIYTGSAKWEEAKTYAEKVITESGYELSQAESSAGFSGFQQLFMGDNDRNPEAMKEIILPIRQDGLHTRGYGGTWTVISSCYGAKMPQFYGTNDAWNCIRARKAAIEFFFDNVDDVPLDEDPNNIRIKAKDDRALFYGGKADGEARKVNIEKVNRFQDGLSVIKWTNLHADGTTDYHDVNIPDTDVPFIRLAEAYLTRAEANFRLNDNAAAKDDVNVLRDRAHATPWTETDVTEMNLIKEWGREFYLEGRRRSDLVRFGMFTTNKYLWDWKGGTENGTQVSSIYNVFPVPNSELNNNPNMHATAGY